MKIQAVDLLAKSFVISIDNCAYAAFKCNFEECGIHPMPKLFVGYTIPNGVHKKAGLIKSSNICNCGFSHMAIVKLAQALDWEYVCIFEDDVVPCNNIMQKMQEALDDIPDDANVVKLGHLGRLRIKTPVVDVNEHFCIYDSSGGHAYVVFRKYYSKYIEKANADLRIDEYAMNGECIYSCKHQLFVQDDLLQSNRMHKNIQKFNTLLKSRGEVDQFNINEDAILVYYWTLCMNFGDLLVPKILSFLTGARCKNIQDRSSSKLISIGSVLDLQDMLNDGDIVWGSGVHCDCKIQAKNLDVRLTRGPLTRDVLLKNGIYAPEKYCDPGVLAPFCYSINKQQTIIRDILVLLHFGDDKQKVSQCLDKLKIHYMFMDKDDAKSILNEIAKSKQVVSSSLHGIIAAEALGKPAVLLRGSGNRELMFKYTDYYLGSGRAEDDIKTTTLEEMQQDLSNVQFTKPAKFDFKSLIETFPLKLKDDNILDKILKYYSLCN